MRCGTLNVSSLYISGSLKTVARELYVTFSRDYRRSDGSRVALSQQWLYIFLWKRICQSLF